MPEVDPECKPNTQTPHPPELIDPGDLADILAQSIAEADAQATLEQAYLGPDALDETALHPLIAAALQAAGWTAHREVPYPKDPGGTPHPRDRERCDLVIPARTLGPLLDPVRERITLDEAQSTLFAPAAETIASQHRPQNAAAPADAAWLEIKTTGTVVYRQGVPTPNTAYANELIAGAVGDATKLARCPALGARYAALIVFTHDPAAIERDLVTATHRVLDHAIDARSPILRTTPITDRAGNTACTIGLIPVEELPPDPH